VAEWVTGSNPPIRRFLPVYYWQMRIEHRIAAGILMLALLVHPALRSQTPDWRAGIVQITNKNLSPGTGFIVALTRERALIITSAHVVEGDGSPRITFQGNRAAEFTAKVLDQQSGDRGFALLEVRNPPATGLRVLEPPPGLQKPTEGTPVTLVGYPAAVGSYFVKTAGISSIRSGDLVLDYVTGVGFSGGPVLIEGKVVGMVYGKEAIVGLAVPAANIDAYLRFADTPVNWSATTIGGPSQTKAAAVSTPTPPATPTPAPPPSTAAEQLWRKASSLQVTQKTYIEIRGAVWLYDNLKAIVSLAQLRALSPYPMFASGPHGADFNFESYQFGYYNLNFVRWVGDNLIPAATNPLLRQFTQPFYDRHLLHVARLYHLTSRDLAANSACLVSIRNGYIARIRTLSGTRYNPGADADPGAWILGSFFQLYDRQVLSDIPKGLRLWAPPREQGGVHIMSTAAGFWVRRTMDGTSEEFRRALDRLLATYDAAWRNGPEAARGTGALAQCK
jgi:hypothetical protein